MKLSNKLPTQRVQSDRGRDGVKVERAGDGASTLMPAWPRSTLAPKFVSPDFLSLAFQEYLALLRSFNVPLSIQIENQKFLVLYAPVIWPCHSKLGPLFAKRRSCSGQPSCGRLGGQNQRSKISSDTREEHTKHTMKSLRHSKNTQNFLPNPDLFSSENVFLAESNSMLR